MTDKCPTCRAPVVTEGERHQFDSSRYHMDAVKKLSEISALKGYIEDLEAVYEVTNSFIFSKRRITCVKTSDKRWLEKRLMEMIEVVNAVHSEQDAGPDHIPYCPPVDSRQCSHTPEVLEKGGMECPDCGFFVEPYT